MLKKRSFWILSIVIIYHCIDSACSEDDEKAKREIWSSESAPNVFDVTNYQKNPDSPKAEVISPFAQVFSAIDSLGFKVNGNVKTTVEFWPPDMDKDKFYKLREEKAAFPLTSWFNFKPFEQKEDKNEPVITSYPNLFSEHKEAKNKPVITSYPKVFSEQKEVKNEPVITSYPNLFSEHKEAKNEPVIISYPTIFSDQKKLKNVPEIASYPTGLSQNYVVETSSKKPSVIVYEDYSVTPSVHPSYESHSTVQPFIDSSVRYNFSKSIHNPTVKYDDTIQQDDYSYYSPTEGSLDYNSHDALTYSGPVVFPTIEPKTERKTTKTFKYFTYVPIIETSSVSPPSPRANKKRKLKKKVKTSSSVTQFAKEIHVVQTPPSFIIATAHAINEDNSIDVIKETSKTERVPSLNNNVSIHYTDMINNLSNLTEQSFSDEKIVMKHDYKSPTVKHIYNSKIIHSTTPHAFLIKVEPEMQEYAQKDVKQFDSVITTASSQMSDEKATEIKENDKNMLVTEVAQTSIVTTTVQPSSTVKKIHRSRFGVRKFHPNKASETVRIKASSTVPAPARSTTTARSSTVRYDKVTTLSKSHHVLDASSEKPTSVALKKRRTTARYSTQKSRSRQNIIKSSNRNSTVSLGKTTKTTVAATTTVRTKIRRTTKNSST